jgi:hypothetical protein
VSKKDAERIGLPPRIFMFTPDQIATMLEVELSYVEKTLLFYEKRQPGVVPRSKMRAINVAPEGETPIWRVSEVTLIAYLKSKGVRFYERGYLY